MQCDSLFMYICYICIYFNIKPISETISQNIILYYGFISTSLYYGWVIQLKIAIFDGIIDYVI